jgi:uncharacterized protein with GYD domain
MGTYIVLANLTEQGMRKLREITQRVQAFRDLAGEYGVAVTNVYWTRGAYDVAAVIEAPDEKSVLALCVAVDARGNVRTRTLRAFPVELMEEILASNAFLDHVAKRCPVDAASEDAESQSGTVVPS